MRLRPELLLHPNIPKPLHTLAPRTVKGEEWWNQERQAAYERAEFRCMACGIPKHEAKYHRWLEAHEHYEMDYVKARMIFMETVALCHSCHNYIHDGRMLMMVRDGRMPESKRLDILAHGDRVTRGLALPNYDYGDGTRKWGDWRLVIDGEEFGPAFETYEQWRTYFQR